MKQLFAALAAVLCCSSAAVATTVSATVTGSDGSPYANGTYIIQLADSNGHLWLNTGVATTQTYYTGSLDNSGSFSIVLMDNATAASGSKWRFYICSSPTATNGQPICFSSDQTVSGSTQSLSSALSAVAPGLSNDPAIPSEDATKHYVDTHSGGGSLSGAVVGSTSATTLRDYINIKDYGALCDGSTDDTTAINNAITAAAGKTLYSPDGTCIHQPLTLSSAIKIVLNPNSTWKLKAGSTTSQLNISASNVQILGGTLDGNSANNPSGQNGIFIASGLTDILIDRVTFLNDTQSHILTLGASGPATSRVIVRHCTFNGAGQHAVFFNWDTTDSEISDNQFLSGSQDAIWVGNSSTGVRIAHNFITGYARMGIEVNLSSSTASITGNTIRNTGSGANAFGISVDTSPNSVVANNSVNLTSPATGNVGIEIVGSDNSAVSGNVVLNAGIGMTINQSSNVTVTGNRIAAFAGSSGILLGSSVASKNANLNVVSGNRITVSQTTGSAIGIWLQANATGANVNDNTLVGNVIDGQNTSSGTAVMLELDAGTLNRNQISSNTISNVQLGINHDNDALTAIASNQFDNVGTKDAGSTTNGRAARFDNSTSDLLAVPQADDNTAFQVMNAANSAAVFRVTTSGDAAVLLPVTFSHLNTCNTGNEGSLASVTDSTTATAGAAIVGGGSSHVLGYCNGTAWTVH